MAFTAQPTPQQVRTAFMVTALGGLLFTLDLPLLRLSMADQWTMVFARGLMLFVAISAIWLLARAKGDATPFIAGKAGLGVALASTIGNMAYIGAVAHTQAANVVFIIALIPVLTAALMHIVLGEKVHGFTWAATLAAFLGAAIIASDGLRSGNWAGDGLAFVSALCSAAIFTIIRGSGKKVATSLALGSLSSSIVALTFFTVSPASILAAGHWGMPALFWLALNGLVAIPLATVLLARGPRLLPSADVSMFFMLETVLTPVWVWLLFGEIPSDRVLIGGTVVVIALLAHSWWRLASSLRAAPVAASNN